MTTTRHTPLILIILDGYGYSDTKDFNAIAQAHTPVMDELWTTSPHTLITGSGEGVGLPADQMGNSEVGHLNLGAGRIVYQEFSRISLAIQDRTFFENPILCEAIDSAITHDKAVHIMGLLSPGGVHSHEEHLIAALELAAERGATKIYLHAILDGRDTPPQSAAASLEKIEHTCKKLHKGKIASIVGRYFAMDRDKRWDRVKLAYDMMTEGKVDFSARTAEEGLNAAYARGETDEFVKPTIIHAAGESPVIVENGDAVLFMNFRADRAREITRAFVDNQFEGFKRDKHPKCSAFVCLTQYDETIDAPIAFPPARLTNIFAEIISGHGMKQLRIAETEKYAHVTFFFNGGVEAPYPGEDREMIPSPAVATYDLQPEMHAPQLTDKLIEAIKSKHYDVIICNYANADMVGHTGNFEATIKAIECLDACMGRVVAALNEVGGELIITADHGNADHMYDVTTKQAHTAHTTSPVPFIYRGRPARIAKHDGILADVCPTMLYLLGLPIPQEMTGKSLVTLQTKG